MEKLLEILRSINGDIDYATEKNLISSGLFVSFDIIQCVSECEEAFDIEIPAEAIIAENFESAETIWHLVESLK